MKLRWALMLPVLSIVAMSYAGRHAQAQGTPAAPGQMPGSVWSNQPPTLGPAGTYVPPGMSQAAYGAPGSVPPGSAPPNLPTGYGPPGMPAGGYGPPPSVGGYGPPPGMMGPGGAPMGPMGPGGMPMGPMGPMGGEYAEGGDGSCPGCGGMGCRNCGGGLHNGLLGDVLGLIGPYPDGGCAAVRWYDFSLEYMQLQRDDAGNRAIDFTSAGIGGPAVLSSSQLNDMDQAPSFRFSGAFQLNAGSNIEFTYFGLFDFSSAASVSDPGNNLFSVFSLFGTAPPFGFDETDESDFQSIDYKSTFDSYEINYRTRWMAPNCRYQGSWLVGFRYFQVDEDFNYRTRSDVNGGAPAPVATALFNTNVNNCMSGVQIGGDVWTCILPGLRIGGEAKAGVFGNHINVDSTINSTSLVDASLPPFTDGLIGNSVSFVGQAEAMLTYRLSYQWMLKLSYQLLYVDGVALATENFNTVPPAIFNPPPGINRRPFIDDNGDIFYHGFAIGGEYTW